MKTMLSLISLFILTSCSTNPTFVKRCSTIEDKVKREKCNKKEMDYYNDTGWRYERFHIDRR